MAGERDKGMESRVVKSRCKFLALPGVLGLLSFLVGSFPSATVLSFQNQCVVTPAQEVDGFVHELDQAVRPKPTPSAEPFSLEAQEAQQLWIEASSIYQKFFNGEASLEDSNRQIDGIASRFDSSPQKKILFLGLARNSFEKMAQSYTHHLILNHLSGSSLDEMDLSRLTDLGVEDPHLYIQLVSQDYEHHFKVLKSKGVSFDSRLGWDFSQFELFLDDLKEGSPVLKAFQALVTSDETLINQLRDPDRSEAIALGNHMILPVQETILKSGIILWKKTSDYQQSIRFHLTRIETLQGQFEQAVKDVNAYSNIMWGRAWELVGLERGDKGQTEPEIRLEMIKSQLRFEIAQLKNHLGVSRELLAQVYEMERALTGFELNEIDKGIDRLKTATALAIAAPIIPVAMYALPAAGAGLVALPGAKALAAPLALSAKMFAAGSAFTAAEVTGRALISSAHGQGSVMDNLLDEARTTGVEGLKMSAMFAAIPLALPAAGGVASLATITATSRSLRAVGLSATAARAQAVQRGAAAFRTTERIGSQAMSTGFRVFGAYAAVDGAMECAKLIDSIHQAAERGEAEQAINQISAEAWSACLSNAVDVAEALVAGGLVAQKGIDLAHQRTAEATRALSPQRSDLDRTKSEAPRSFPEASEGPSTSPPETLAQRAIVSATAEIRETLKTTEPRFSQLTKADQDREIDRYLPHRNARVVTIVPSDEAVAYLSQHVQGLGQFRAQILLDGVQSAAKTLKSNDFEVLIFGSRANDRARPKSDFDLAFWRTSDAEKDFRDPQYDELMDFLFDPRERKLDWGLFDYWIKRYKGNLSKSQKERFEKLQSLADQSPRAQMMRVFYEHIQEPFNGLSKVQDESDKLTDKLRESHSQGMIEHFHVTPGFEGHRNGGTGPRYVIGPPQQFINGAANSRFRRNTQDLENSSAYLIRSDGSIIHYGTDL